MATYYDPRYLLPNMPIPMTTYQKPGKSLWKYLLAFAFMLIIVGGLFYYFRQEQAKSIYNKLMWNSRDTNPTSTPKLQVVTTSALGGLKSVLLNDPTETSTPTVASPISTNVNVVSMLPTSKPGPVYTAPDPIYSKTRCSTLPGYRLPGAGYKSGKLQDDSIEPGFGSEVPNADACYGSCAMDPTCKQYLFDTFAKRCYKMNKVFPYTDADKSGNYDSGICS